MRIEASPLQITVQVSSGRNAMVSSGMVLILRFRKTSPADVNLWLPSMEILPSVSQNLSSSFIRWRRYTKI